MKRVKFTGFGANSAIGGFGPGDFATVSDELAQHLVEEAGVAKYDTPPAGAQKPETAQMNKPEQKPAAKGKQPPAGAEKPNAGAG
jgi:hypothetical protein